MRVNNLPLRIIIHLGLWAVLFFLPSLVIQSTIRLPHGFGEIMNWILVIIFFYVNFLWLIPSFLNRRRFLIYFGGIMLMLSTSYFSTEAYQRYKFNQEVKAGTVQAPPPADQHRKPPRFRGYFAALWCFAILALGTSMRVTEESYINEKQKKEMENQKLGAELSLLKSQINPHFFFNTLNSIYSLAIIKSDRTPEAVLKLSELMRYIIYDTEKNVVPLSKEAEYIANYIELQRLRLPADVKVTLNTDLGTGDAIIEPLLLLPFVENAFKHGVDAEKGGIITVDLKRKGRDLTLHVENPIVQEVNHYKDRHTGIGINNTLKRLSLLYQNDFTFTAGPVKKVYVIDLKLKLKDDEVSDS